jgi:hypothetical protein
MLLAVSTETACCRGINNSLQSKLCGGIELQPSFLLVADVHSAGQVMRWGLGKKWGKKGRWSGWSCDKRPNHRHALCYKATVNMEVCPLNRFAQNPRFPAQWRAVSSIVYVTGATLNTKCTYFFFPWLRFLSLRFFKSLYRFWPKDRYFYGIVAAFWAGTHTGKLLTCAGALSALLSTCFHAGFLLGLFFDSEDGGDIFLRNVGWLSADYTALYPRRQYSSQPPPWESQILQLLSFRYCIWESNKATLGTTLVKTALSFTPAPDWSKLIGLEL